MHDTVVSRTPAVTSAPPKPVVAVLGGTRRSSAGLRRHGAWSTCVEGRLLLVDLQSGRVETLLVHRTPRDYLPTDFEPNLTFKAGSLSGRSILITTEREVLRFDLTRGVIDQAVSSRDFNDLHHAVACGSELLAVDAGRDLVHRIDSSGQVRESLSVSSTPDAGTRSDRTDYRRISTKPHRHHPNFIFSFGAQWFVTRCNDGDVVPLGGDAAPLRIAEGLIHDGVRSDASTLFTAVDGRIIEVDIPHRQRVREIDLHQSLGKRSQGGWCRGIAQAGDLLVVGFSTLRETKARSALRYAMRRTGGSRSHGATRLEVFERSGRHLESVPLSAFGLDTVFSVLPLTESVAQEGFPSVA